MKTEYIFILAALVIASFIVGFAIGKRRGKISQVDIYNKVMYGSKYH